MTRREALLAALLALVGCAHHSNNLSELAWLAGQWRGAHGDGVYEERWQRAPDGALRGSSRFTVGEREVETEVLSIERRGDGAVYVATPSGQSRTEFRLVRQADGEAVFENPAHDFPTRIVYRRTLDGITARIEGPSDAGVRGVDFVLRRVAP